MGLERLKLVMEACGAPMPEEPRCDIALIPLGAKASVQCSAMAADLRTDGFYAETDLMNRSLKAQLKYANKIGARYTMVIGDSELEAGKARLKDMDSGEEQEVAFDRLADVLMEKEAAVCTARSPMPSSAWRSSPASWVRNKVCMTAGGASPHRRR